MGQGLGLRRQALRVNGILGFWVCGSGLKVDGYAFRSKGLGLGIEALGFRLRGLGFRVWELGYTIKY